MSTDRIALVAVETIVASVGAVLLWRKRETGIGPFARGVPLFGSVFLGLIGVLGLVALVLTARGD